MDPFTSAARKWSAAERCGSAACAEAERTATGVKLTSTLPNAGQLDLTSDEFATFVSAVKAGELDDLI